MSALKYANLCWGQRFMWLRYHQLPPHERHETDIVLRLDIAHAVTLANCRTALNYLTRRHEALRTTYDFDADSGPRQRVHSPAALPVIHVSTERDGTATPAEVVEQLVGAEFDLSTQWPIRACVITTGGVPKQLVVVLNHLAVDVWTVGQIKRELRIQCAGFGSRRPASLEPVRHQPLDLARYEASAEAAAEAGRALAYWREEISALPADTFGARRRYDAAPEARAASLTSPSLLDASRRVGARHRVWPSLVHMTAYTMMMAAYTGGGTAGHLSFTSNRESSPHSDVLTCMFSPLLMRVDCQDDPAFSQLLRRVAERFERARSHSYVPYDEVVELVSRESLRRGRAMRIGSEVNFIKQASRDSRAKRTKFAWASARPAWARYGLDTYFRIDEWRDAVVVTFDAMSSVMDADAMERFLRGYEAVVLAHVEPSADLRVSDVARMAGFPAPAPTGGRVVREGDDLVDLDQVEAVLERHPLVRLAHVSTADADDGRIVAHVVAERPLSPARLRTHFLGHLYDHPVRCPDRFLIHHHASEPGGESVEAPVVEGDGRGGEPTCATGEAERVLAAVVRQVNGCAEVDLSDTYTSAGGRALRIPRVLEMLGHHGWQGLRVQHLTSARPLRALAGLLVPVIPAGRARQVATAFPQEDQAVRTRTFSPNLDLTQIGVVSP
ncbi:hypothetical protein GCM10022226_57310 [Sphaerisporangium flaviroseum]|uniref:Condensation domain-containing protein n=1 Tax=Sphaerisporangium flaviroseum TaxID=509199 RepID=A0ABP7IWX8_9ACTN